MMRELSFWILLVTFRENYFTSSDLNKTKYKNYNDELNNSAIGVLAAEHKPPETIERKN